MQSVGDLQSAVQRELAWRKRELSDVRALASNSEETLGHVFRGGQVLLCAHWEGFLKRAVALYVDHVFSQKLPLSDFAPNIVAIAYFRDVIGAADAKYPGSEDHHIRLAKKIITTIGAEISTPCWDVNTEGNPGSETLDRILKSVGLDKQLGMDAASWTTTRVFIDEQLVRDRHQVAHGEGLPIQKVNFLERADRLLRLLDVLGEQLVGAAERRSYLSITVPS